jgi:hypothetical protein
MQEGEIAFKVPPNKIVGGMTSKPYFRRKTLFFPKFFPTAKLLG